MSLSSKEKRDRGLVVIAEEICKGCGLCVEACPVDVLKLANQLNLHGYHPARYTGTGCTACAICFYICPEPGAITVYKTSTTEDPTERLNLEGADQR